MEENKNEKVGMGAGEDTFLFSLGSGNVRHLQITTGCCTIESMVGNNGPPKCQQQIEQFKGLWTLRLLQPQWE